jgi:hypothetical protein
LPQYANTVLLCNTLVPARMDILKYFTYN